MLTAIEKQSLATIESIENIRGLKDELIKVLEND
jgi:hypothetical protein